MQSGLAAPQFAAVPAQYASILSPTHELLSRIEASSTVSAQREVKNIRHDTNRVQMSIPGEQFCICCGEPPDGKTREHVVPYWLLEMTGDPLRVVPFGTNYANGKKLIEYSWSNFVAP